MHYEGDLWFDFLTEEVESLKPKHYTWLAYKQPYWIGMNTAYVTGWLTLESSLACLMERYARFICTVCIRVGSGDPVRVLRLFHNKYTGYNWSIYCWDYVQLVATKSNVLLYLLPMSVQLCCWRVSLWKNEPDLNAVLYCMVPYIATCVDVSWNGIFRDRSVILWSFS